MSTYYEYRDVLVLIAHRLFKMDGWKVYGYHADDSDLMTDYYSPASWGGIATKNGYTLVVGRPYAAEEKRYTYTVYSEEAPEIREKIAKLERMTQANGASEQEEATAQAAILKLKKKQTATQTTKEDYTPGHMANPPRCNWHIEKDGIIMDKGTGLLKFSSLPDITFDHNLKDWQDFNNLSKDEYIKNLKNEYMHRWNEDEERAQASAERQYKVIADKYKLLDTFNQLINRFNTVAGGMVGNSGENGYTYAVKKITKYKKVWKFVPSSSGSFVPGQCFRLVSSFNYGCHSGYVYRFVSAYEGQSVRGERVSLKSNKNLTGLANRSNTLGYYAADNATENHGRDKDKFLKWIEQGAIEWGEVVEVSEPYEVEKYVKVDANGNEYKASKAATESTPEETENTTETEFIINADVDTRDGSPLWVVTLSDHVSRDRFNEIREEIKSKGGYYSRFKKGFIFKEDPTELLKNAPEETSEEAQTEEATLEEIPTEAPTQKNPVVYGENVESCDYFTPDELTQLLNGDQVKKGDKWIKKAYFAIEQRKSVKFVYSVCLTDEELRPGDNANFFGFIYSGKFYNDFDLIKNRIIEDCNAELLKQIPTEAAAELNAVNLEKYKAESIDFYKNHDFSKTALTHFLDDTLPQLCLYKNRSSLTMTNAIDYLLNPAEVVKGFVNEYKQLKRAEILKDYIEYNKIITGLNEIRKDKTNPAHLLKSIKEATAGGEEKTFKIMLSNGHTVKADANAVRRIPYCGWLSSYSVQCADRQYLNKNEYGRPDDVTPIEILSISHGSRVLYKKAS